MDLQMDAMRGMLELLAMDNETENVLEFFSNNAMQASKGPPKEYSAILPPPHVTRQAYERDFARNANESSITKTSTQVYFQQSVAAALEHGVAPEIAELQPIKLREVAARVNVIHDDRVLFVQVAHDPYRITGTQILVEDMDGDLVLFGVYNYVGSSEEPTDLLPKEAWIAAAEGRDMQKETVDPKKLRQMGNNYFKIGKLNQAEKCYSRALNHPLISLEDKVACLSNRAEVFLRLEQWEDALKDSRDVTGLDENHTKGNFRQSQALLRLGKSKEALKILDLLVENNPTQEEFQKARLQAKRLEDEERGIFNLAKIRQDLPSSTLEGFHANYVSPSVKLGAGMQRTRHSYFRGCIATRQLVEGELVCASKALVYVPKTSKGEFGLRVNSYSKQMELASDTALIAETVRLLKRRPMLGKEIYKLSSGDHAPPQNEMHKIHLGRIRGIKTSNAFKGQSEGLGALIDWERLKKEREDGGRLTEHELERLAFELDSGGAGLWVQESMFNHSCYPNCTWSQIHDHIFIRTTRPVSEGEELCITYIGDQDSFDERTEKFRDWISPGNGFSCSCEACCLLRNNPSLLSLEREVDAAFKEAARIVTLKGVPMAMAAENVMPEYRRNEIMGTFQVFPLHLQHNTVRKVEIMQGAVLNARGNHEGALQCYKRAAAIKYAIGGGIYEYSKDLWRLVGSAMRCGEQAQAKVYMASIRSMRFFNIFGSNADAAYRDLTLKYASPWWVDRFDSNVAHQLIALSNDANQDFKRSTYTKEPRKPKAAKKKGKQQNKKKGNAS